MRAPLRNRLTLLLLAGLGAAVARPSDADAALRIGGGPILVPRFCSAPTVAQCESTSWHKLCGTSTACAGVLKSRAAVGGVNATATAAMSSVPADAPALRPDGTLGMTRTVPYTNAITVPVAPHSVSGLALPTWVALEKTGPSLASASAMVHPDWYADGRKIQSCAEYVYDRHWDYDRFNDAAHALGNDSWSIVALAMSPDPSLPGLDGRTLYQHNESTKLPNDPIAVQIGSTRQWFQISHVKNGFYTNPALSTYMLAEVFPSTGGLPPDFPSDAWSNLGSAATYQTTLPGDEWQWHKTMWTGQQNSDGSPIYAPADYAYANLKTAHLAQLVEMVWQTGFEEAWYDYTKTYPTSPCPYKTKTGTCAMAVENAYGSGATPVQAPINLAPYHLPTRVPLAFYTQTADVTDGTWLSNYMANHPGAQAASNAVWNAEYDEAAKFPGDANKIAKRANRARYEYLLAEFIAEEWNSPGHGCLDPSSTLCDWSPAMFVKGYRDHMWADEASDFRACVAATGDDFAAVAYADQAECGGLLRQDFWFPDGQGLRRDYTYSTSDVAEFIDNFNNRGAAWKKAAAQAADQEQAIASMPVDVSQGGFAATTSDSGNFGDPAAFTGSFSYSANWNLLAADYNTTTAVKTICAVTGSMSSSFDARAGGLGLGTHSILSGTYGASDIGGTATMSGSMTVLDKQIFDASGLTVADVGTEFNLVAPIDSTPIASKSLADAWFLLAGIVPVHLQASVGASASVTASLTGRSHPCDHTSTNPITFYELDGTMTPSVRADLIAQAAVDVGVADAGVRVTLELVSLALPYETRIDVHNGTLGPRTVYFKQGLSADIDELAGDVELFADVNYLLGSWHTSKSVFSWDGFHQHKELWNPPPTTFNLDALGARLNGIPGADGTPPLAPVCSSGTGAY